MSLTAPRRRTVRWERVPQKTIEPRVVGRFSHSCHCNPSALLSSSTARICGGCHTLTYYIILSILSRARRFFRASYLSRLPPHRLHQPIHRVSQWFDNHILGWEVAKFVDAEATFEDADTVEAVFDTMKTILSCYILRFAIKGFWVFYFYSLGERLCYLARLLRLCHLACR